VRVALTDTAYVSVKTMNEAFRDPRLWRSRRQRANVSRLVRTGIALIAFGFVVEKVQSVYTHHGKHKLA
jgi:uncharacterized membrane protein YidH (DUF202 family)